MSIHEECGVFGIFTPQEADVASYAYYALYSLQHRGQESAGIVVNDDGLNSLFDGAAVESLLHDDIGDDLAVGRGLEDGAATFKLLPHVEDAYAEVMKRLKSMLKRTDRQIRQPKTTA